MRFGARRRTGGKHAGERSRRRRSPEVPPQEVEAPYDAPAVVPPVSAPQPAPPSLPSAVDLPPPTLTPAAPQPLPVEDERPSRRTRRRLRREQRREEKTRRAYDEALGIDAPTPAPPAPPPAPVREPEPAPVLVPSAPAADEDGSTPQDDLSAEERRRTRRERRAARRAAREDDIAAAREAHAAAIEAVPLVAPSAGNGLLAVFQRRYLLKLLVKREVSARYQGSFLGFLWSYIGPLCQFFVYWFVIGYILGLHDNVPNFGIHVFAGLVVVHFFTETFGAGTRSIVRNKAIVVKLPLPREMFPVASMLVSLFHVVPQLVILTVACLAYGWVPDATGMAALLLALFIAMTLGTAGALMFSAANVYFRDFSKVVDLLHLFIRFSVPMIYPYSFVDDRFGSAAQYYLFNPLADCVLLVQRAFWIGTTPDPEHYAKSDLPPDLMLWGLSMAGIGLVLLVIGQLVFSKLESKIPERL